MHADETPVQVLNEENKKNTTKSYMWVYSTSTNTNHRIRMFKYAPGRSGDNAKEFLKGFNGYLHTDGFSGYGKGNLKTYPHKIERNSKSQWIKPL